VDEVVDRGEGFNGAGALDKGKGFGIAGGITVFRVCEDKYCKLQSALSSPA